MAYNQSTSQTAQQPRNEFSTSRKYVCCKDSDKNSVKEIAAFIFDVFMNAVRKFFLLQPLKDTCSALLKGPFGGNTTYPLLGWIFSVFLIFIILENVQLLQTQDKN